MICGTIEEQETALEAMRAEILARAEEERERLYALLEEATGRLRILELREELLELAQLVREVTA